MLASFSHNRFFFCFFENAVLESDVCFVRQGTCESGFIKLSSFFARMLLRPKEYGVVRNKKGVTCWYCASLNKQVVLFLL